MSNAEVMDLFYEFFVVSSRLAAPVLLVSMVVGIVISIFQAATQIHEQTVTFVPKLLVIALMLLLFGSNMLVTMQDYTRAIFSMI
ncbi:MAG: flagellar biosynthetic protein FliQ [Hungatella sp.]